MAKKNLPNAKVYIETSRATTKICYRTDGVILQNTGTGWRRYGKLKDIYTPQMAIDALVDQAANFAERYPLSTAYYKQLHTFKLDERFHIHRQVEAVFMHGKSIIGDAFATMNMDRVYRDKKEYMPIGEFESLVDAYVNARNSEGDVYRQVVFVDNISQGGHNAL